MSKRLKSFALVSLVFSLTCGVGLAANDVISNHTLAQTATSSDTKAEGDKLFQEGVEQFRRGEYPKALQTYQRVLEIRRKLGDRAGIGQTLNNIGQVYNGLQQNDKALEILQQALTIRREIKDRAGEGETLDNIGGVYLALFKEEEALKTLQQALEIRREVKDQPGEAVTLSRMGFTYTFLKQQDKGLKLLKQALAMHQELGDKFQEGFTLFRIGVAYDNINDYPNALDWLNKALAMNREGRNHAWEGRSLLQIGLIYFYKKEYDNALKFFQQSLPIIQEAGIRYSEASLLAIIGDTYFNQKKYDEAINFYQKALPIARELKKKSLESEVLTSLGDCYRKQEKYDIALEFYQQALPLMREVKNKSEEGRILFLIGSIYNLQGKSEQAIENLQKSLPIAREIKNQTLEAKILAAIGSTYGTQKQFDRAIEFYQQALALERQPLNNRLVQLDILTQIMLLYGLSASEAGRKKDYTRAISQENQKLNLVAEALNIARELKDSAAAKEVMRIQSEAYSSIGYYYLNLQELQKAQDFIQQGLTIARQSGNLKAERYALSYLGGVYMAQGDNTKVIEVGKQELEIARLLKDLILEVGVLLGLANTYNVLGDYEQGIQFSQQALIKAEEIDIQKVPENLQEYALGRKPSALGTLSLIYMNLGEYDKALEFAQKSLNLVRSLKKPKLEAKALIDIGNVYNTSQDFQKAIEFTQQALKIARDIQNTDLEAEALKKLSAAYTGKGDYQQALDSAQQILVIAEKTQNLNLKIDALDLQRQIYTNQGNYQKTLELFQEALKVAKLDNNPYYEWLKLLELGAFYNSLGDYQKNIEYLQQALSLAKKMQNPQFEGTTLFVLAYTYFGKGEPQKTIEFANQGLAIYQKNKSNSTEIMVQLVLSLGYGELNNEQKAIEAAQASLALAKKGKNPNDEKTVLTVLGNLQRKFGKKQEAIKTYNQALAIKVQAKAVGADSSIYAGLGRTYAELNQPNIAITYYKEAINRFEEVRIGVQGLTPDLQKSFLNSIIDFDKMKVSDIYRQLAELLIKQGRDKEALYVQDLLRGQEIRESTNTRSSVTEKPQIPLTETEQKVPALNESIIALGYQITQCESTNSQECSQLKQKRSTLITQHIQQIEGLNKLISENRHKDDIFFDPTILGKIREIVEATPNTVMIYPLVGERELHIQLYGKEGVVKTVPVPVGRVELGNAVQEFRSLMEKCEKIAYCGGEDITKVKAASKKLYDWLIKPIEKELNANPVENLVFALDRVTRYIPTSALFDGNQYLIEKYSIYVAPSAALTDISEPSPSLTTGNTNILGMGLSEAVAQNGAIPAFNGLKSVPKELDFIVKEQNDSSDKQGIYNGKTFLNSQFNFSTIENNLKDKNVLHLATHGVFDPNSPQKSYVLLGDKQPMSQNMIYTLVGLKNIHLVVLSACQTALASPNQEGVEINAFAYHFLKNGAKSVMATLWKVDDPSTAKLMELFYRNLATGKMTKSQALRQAQLSMLKGNNYTVENGDKRGAILEREEEALPRNEQRKSSYSHPYYWAPFILIGNGL